MNNFSLKIVGLSKSFEPMRNIFEDISFELRNGEIMAITGRNGSGKSTLLKIIAGVIRPGSGSVDLSINREAVKADHKHMYFGFVAPYLTLYEEFTPPELFRLFSRMRKNNYDKDYTDQMMDKFNIYSRRKDSVSTFSSGMKQRVKYILAFMNKPEILLLDEPTSNLDSSGISTLLALVFEHQTNGGGVIIASNDDREIAICRKTVSLEK